MRKIRVTICDGPCTSSITRDVIDIPTCIEKTLLIENVDRLHRTCGIQDIRLDFKDGEVLGRQGVEEGQESGV